MVSLQLSITQGIQAQQIPVTQQSATAQPLENRTLVAVKEIGRVKRGRAYATVFPDSRLVNVRPRLLQIGQSITPGRSRSFSRGTGSWVAAGSGLPFGPMGWTRPGCWPFSFGVGTSVVGSGFSVSGAARVSVVVVVFGAVVISCSVLVVPGSSARGACAS